jgi:hypothetical protein
LCAIQASDFGFNDVLARRCRTGQTTSVTSLSRQADEYLKNARRVGIARPSFTVQRVDLTFWSEANLIRATETVAPDA